MALAYIVIANMSEYDNDKAYILWMSMLRAPSTKELYSHALTSFCNHVEVTPSTLVKMGEKKVREHVLSYLGYLKTHSTKHSGKTTKAIPRLGQKGDAGYKISVNSIRYYLAGIKSFLDCHQIELKWKSIQMAIPEKVTTKLRAYTNEELNRMLALADRREKVAILLMASGGLRVGAIPTLRMRDIVVLDSGIAKVHAYVDSANDNYWTLVSPECVQAIEEYKHYLTEQLGENITKDSYVVRDQFNIKPIMLGTLSRHIWDLFTRCELPKAELQPDHAFRKYFNTVCINSGVNHTIKECLLGHSVKLDDVYYDLSNSQTLAKFISEYEKALSELTITEDARRALSNEVKLKNVPEIQQLQERIKKLEQEKFDITQELGREEMDREFESQQRVEYLDKIHTEKIKPTLDATQQLLAVVQRLEKRINQLESKK